MGLLNKTNPKFKVGDRVKVLDGTSIPDYIGSWTHDMQWYVGREKTISQVLHTRRGRCYYYLEGCVFSWDERGLEKVDEKEPRFKVGDRVKILDGSGIPNYIGEWASSMSKYVGREATIARVTPRETGYAYSLEGSIFAWDERGLEKVDESKPRFKVGDPVRVISGQDKPYNGLEWCKGMDALVGKDVFISQVSTFQYGSRPAYSYKVKPDTSLLGWWLGEDWIVPRSTNEKHSSSEGGEKELKGTLGRMLDTLVSDEKSEFSIGDRVRVTSIRVDQDGLALKAKEPYVGSVGCIDGKGMFGYKVNGLPSSWLPGELVKVDPDTRTPKYKVGDRVRVLDGRDDKGSHVYWVDGDGMTKCIGLVCTIQEVCAHIGYVSYRFANKVSPWCFDERWLIPENQARPADDKVPSDLPDDPATIHFLPFERR